MEELEKNAIANIKKGLRALRLRLKLPFLINLLCLVP